MDFEPLPEHRLIALSDEKVVDYIDEAREAGAKECVTEAVGVLAWRFEDHVAYRVALKIPAHDRHDVVIDVQIAVMGAAFDGKTIGEFRSFMNTITGRMIANYHRKPGRKIFTVQIGPGDGEDDGETFEPSTEDHADLIDNMDAVKLELARRSPLHRKVIELYGSAAAGFGDLSAEEVKDIIDGDETDDTVSLDNIAQIWSRFRRSVQEQLSD